MLPRRMSAPGILLLSGLIAAPTLGGPLAVRPDGRASSQREIHLQAEQAPAVDACELPAVRNELYPEQGYCYFFSCEGDEIARRVDFNDCIATSYCGNWYPRTVTVSFWISASLCRGSYPYTTSAFDAQLAIYPADPYNPNPEIPIPTDDPATMSAVVRIPSFTRTSASGDDALVTVALPLHCDCLSSSPFFVSLRFLDVEPEDDYCAGAPCVGRLPGLMSTGQCTVPGCTGPNDPVETLTPNATFFRNAAQGMTEWTEAAEVGIRSDISLSVNVACCDAIEVQNSTWGRIKSLQND